MTTGDDRNTIIVNLYGGVAGALIEQAFAQLPAFRELKMCSTLYPRCIASHVSREHALFQFLSNANITENLHGECQNRSTIFKEMKRMGFETEFRGPFGLQDELEVQWDCTSSLADWGIDVFDEQDSSFCRYLSDKVHDELVFTRGLQSISRWKAPQKHALMLNLVGCRSVEKLVWDTGGNGTHTANIRVNSLDGNTLQTKKMIETYIPYPNGESMEKYISKSVVVDSIGDVNARSQTIPFCLAEYNKRQGVGGLGTDNVIQTSLCAHGLAWLHLCNIDKQLERLITHLKQNGIFETTSIIFLSTKGVSLFEHGTMSAMPWESSLRCFALVHRAGQSYSEVLTNPISSSSFGSLVLHTCGSNVVWKKINPSSFHEVTSALSIQLDTWCLKLYSEVEGYDMFKFPAFCIRLKLFHDRWYGITAWFSVDQLLRQADGEVDKRECLLTTRQFANPVTEENCSSLLLQVYDHMTDIEEVHDLYLDDHWKESVHGRALLSKYFSEVLLWVGDTVTVDFRSFLLDTPPELPSYSGDLAVFLESNFDQGSTGAIESKLASVSGDVTVVVSNAIESLKILPGIFCENWAGELVIGANTVTFSNGGVVINSNHVVRRERFYINGRQVCFAFVRRPKTTEHSAPPTVVAAKGRVKRIERRGNR